MMSFGPPKGVAATITLSLIASTTTSRIRVVGLFRAHADGELVPFARELAHAVGDRTLETTDLATDVDGEVVALSVEPVDALKRGQAYVSVQMSFHDITLDLARGYVYDGYRLNLGSFVEPGPGGGEGFLSWVAAFAGDRAGNAAAVDVSLAATNAFRKVYGIAWYYHCDTVAATRTFIRPRLLNLGGAKPTGFTTTGDNGLFWFGSGDITLTTDEEGAHIIVSGEAKDGRGVRVDNGTITITAANADPSPFPLPVTEAELAVIRFPAITNGEATDTHSAYILIEEWLVL